MATWLVLSGLGRRPGPCEPLVWLPSGVGVPSGCVGHRGAASASPRGRASPASPAGSAQSHTLLFLSCAALVVTPFHWHSHTRCVGMSPSKRTLISNVFNTRRPSKLCQGRPPDPQPSDIMEASSALSNTEGREPHARSLAALADTAPTVRLPPAWALGHACCQVPSVWHWPQAPTLHDHHAIEH